MGNSLGYKLPRQPRGPSGQHIVPLKDKQFHSSTHLDDPKAVTASAEAGKGSIHVPLGRWVEKAQLLTRVHIAQALELHGGCVEKYVGVAAMVDVLEPGGGKEDVLGGRHLDGQVVGGAQPCSVGECTQRLPSIQGHSRMQRLVLGLLAYPRFRPRSLLSWADALFDKQTN